MAIGRVTITFDLDSEWLDDLMLDAGADSMDDVSDYDIINYVYSRIDEVFSLPSFSLELHIND